MIGLTCVKRFFLAEYPVDFRKGHFGLLSEARRLGLEPYTGDCVAFVSRDRRRVKALYGNSTGLMLFHKIFSKGTLRTNIRFLDNPQVQSVSAAEIALLFEGCSYTVHSKPSTWIPSSLANSTGS